MIDFFFALVLGQGILRFDEVIQAPLDANLQVWIALVAIYYTVVRSFVAWHAAIETRRYKIGGDERTTELWRVYIDVLIVAVYAFMLFSAEPLIATPGADIRGLFWAFPLLFLLYGAWGYFRRIAWGPDEFMLPMLVLFFVLYVAVALAYTTAMPGMSSCDSELVNLIALGVVLALMGLYRYINFWQGDNGRARWFGMLPRPQLPKLRPKQ
jgi:hypothetical protein